MPSLLYGKYHVKNVWLSFQQVHPLFKAPACGHRNVSDIIALALKEIDRKSGAHFQAFTTPPQTQIPV